MLTKKILKNLRKAHEAYCAGTEYHNAAVELTKQCKGVTEDEFHQVFDGAPITARTTYWLAMHAKDQWREASQNKPE